jgi:hypothetical protein
MHLCHQPIPLAKVLMVTDAKPEARDHILYASARRMPCLDEQSRDEAARADVGTAS